jgi:cellulose synthase operon protein C
VPSYLPPEPASSYTAPATQDSSAYIESNSISAPALTPYPAPTQAAVPTSGDEWPTAPAATAYPQAASGYAAPTRARNPNPGAYAAPAAPQYASPATAAAPSAYPYANQAAPVASTYPNGYAAPVANNPYALPAPAYAYGQPQSQPQPQAPVYISQADTPWPAAAPTRYAAAQVPLPASPAPARLATKKRKLTHTVRTAPRAPVYAQQQAPVAYPQTPPLPYAQQPYPAYQQQYVPQPPAPAPVQTYAYTQQAIAPATQQTLSVAQELAAIDQEQSSSVSGGMIFRNRTGENGLSNLTDIEAPLQGRVAVGNGHVVITATPVTLDAGTSDGDTFSYTPATSSSTTGTYSGNELTRARFGSGLTSLYPCSPADVCSYKYSSFGSQTATGVGLQLGYETKNVQANVGVTPLGFAQTNVLGGLKYSNGITDKVSYSLAVTRQAVTDSLLSYAGARDASTGLKWGGVVSNNAHGDLGWDDGTSGVYLNAQFMYLEGDHVERNYGFKGGGGVYTRLWHDANHAFTVGVNTTLMGYDKNQSYYTYGQGGYFSPQQYVILNIPVELAGRDGLFSYDLKGSIGVQHYHEKASAYFPLDPNLQSIAAEWGNTASLSGGSLDAGGMYPAQSSSGVSYSILANAEYQLSPQLTVGATASLGNAYEYREWLAAIYVRYSFTPQRGATLFPPAGFNSPYLGG